MPKRDIAIEFTIKVTDVQPAELVGLLEAMGQLTKGRLEMDLPTRQLLRKYSRKELTTGAMKDE